MTKDNEQFAREKELASQYEQKMTARRRLINEKLRQILPRNPLRVVNFPWLLEELYTAAFIKEKYEKPSEFFLAQMPWIFGLVVHDRFRDAFLTIADQITDYPHAVGWGRRSFRSSNFVNYLFRFSMMLEHFADDSTVDADICDILTGNLPEEVRAFLKHRKCREEGFTAEVLAYELDRDNPRLEQIVTGIIMGEGSYAKVSHELIQGIVMSRNERMHRLLCKLLLAARQQEGLRQAICEAADSGSREAFRAILGTVAEHDLIRYSSVKRAVGTWLGLMTEETRDLDRISGKSLELLCQCLDDPGFREECLNSEDAMQIYIAIWSCGFERVERATELLDKLSREGTHHQVLTAGYYITNLSYPGEKQQASRQVLKRCRDRYDILAVYLPSFIPFPNSIANKIINFKQNPELDTYFDSREEAEEFCDWLMEVHGSMKKKELVFSPCIFPWFSAALKKSDLVEKAIIIACLIGDQTRIDRLCAYIPDCEAFGRELYFKILTMGKKTPAVRKAIIAGLQDKSFDTRRGAYERAKGMSLTEEEYLQIEQMLRLRYDDLRRNTMELLLKQENEALQGSVRRLLESSKVQMRTAGLDLVTQLAKQEGNKELVSSCMEYVRGIAKPTTQEKILIDALTPKQEEKADVPLFTEADHYVSVVEIDDYARDCIRAFMELFPDSKLEAQILAGVPVTHDAQKEEILPCAAAKAAGENLKSLSDFFIAHEKETFTHFIGREVLLSAAVSGFFVRKSDGTNTVPRTELWEQWRDENHITIQDLFGMLVLSYGQSGSFPYLIRCGKYIADLYGPGFEKQCLVRYAEHLQLIIHELIFENIPEDRGQKLASALGIWIARCLPDEMLIGDRGSGSPDEMRTRLTVPTWSSDEQDRLNIVAMNNIHGPLGHFIAHPQISRFLYKLKLTQNENMRYIIPIGLNVYERTYESTAAYMRSCGHKTADRDRVTLLLNQIYGDKTLAMRKANIPEASTWLYAYHYGLINERTLYYQLIQGGFFKAALQLVTAVCAMKPADGEAVSVKTFSLYNSYSIRRGFTDFIGSDGELDEEQMKLVQLCRKVAGTLVPIVVEKELRRGDTPTEYSLYVTGIHALSGAETFVRILSALGKDSLDRSIYYWGSSASRRGNLSYLLARCAPAAGDTAGKLAELLKGTDISEKRLVEAALYNPAWIDIIGEYLNYPGFKSACYYFMAHMNERFDEQKKAVIARYTPLSEDELNQGAFDVAWFHTAYDQLGEKKFDLIYDAAKYISDGGKHTRARKYADAALGRLDISGTEATIKDKRNKDLLMAYAIIPLTGEDDLIHRYLYLQQFLKESRQFGAQRSANEKKAVETALRNLATNAGFSDPMRLTLRMETKLVEDNRELFEDREIGEWVFRLEVDGQGSAEILCFKDGKRLKSLPAKVKKDEYVLRLQDTKKLLTEQYRRTRRMFEQAMEDGSKFTLVELRQLHGNRVVAPILEKLLFTDGENIGFFDGENLINTEKSAISSDETTQLLVAHPFCLYKSGNWHRYQKHLFDNRIVQPFRQVFRELYVKTKDELGCYNSLRYAGNQIQPRKAAACLKERRWVADIEAGLQKVYYQENIVATIYALADWFTPADIEAPTLEYVAFFDRKTGAALKIDDIPDVVFSEVMRDVDMAVSVAHAGGVDPETSHSTVEMRAAILSFTLPLLRLDNVRIEGSHAFIEGSLAEYSVHLGSGVVHQVGGTMLNVLPVHSQHRGRYFLPFVDDDPKTAEIISKVILFSEDRKLKDPTILQQISRS